MSPFTRRIIPHIGDVHDGGGAAEAGVSEYQYYEFQAVDRPLDETDRQALRAISTRARITATSFTNSYEWGGLKGDPADFMKRWFDLHLYLANWGTRRLMIRLPKRLGDDEIEPMAGIGPLTGALRAFAEFFGIDPDLVQVAADRPIDMKATSPDAAGDVIAAMTEGEKADLLTRLFHGDPHIAVELGALARKRLGEHDAGLSNGTRTAGELRSCARAVRLARDHVKVKKAAAARRRHAEEAAKARLVRIDALARRGEGAWQEVEAEIERRNAPGYDKAACPAHARA
jgi:hypothetical protein